MTRLFYFVLTFALVAIAGAKEIRIGLIGLDTSHVTAFTIAKAFDDLLAD